MNDKIRKKIDKVNIVSFDVFDTLLYRSKYDIKDIFIKTAINLRMDVPKYLLSRSTAEAVAMQANEGNPVCIEDIFEYVDCQHVAVKDVIANEIELELQNISRNDDIYLIYQYCLEHDKRVIITSDMYLHRDTISNMLQKCGYNTYENIFVSSEYNKSKYKGDLYSILKKVYGESSILHIGDTKRSDYINALLNGLNAYRYKADYSRNKYYSIGYNKMGCFFDGFAKWIQTNLVKKKYDHVFFLSREGLFLQKICFSRIGEIDSEYLYVSRRSLTVPRLFLHNSYEELDRVIVFSSAFTAKTFLSRLGIEKNDKEIVAKTGISSGTIFYKNSYKTDERLRHLYTVFYDEIVLNAKVEWNNLIHYLKHVCFEGRVAIVDIGWNGTMQNALQSIIDEGNLNVTTLDGYYFGVVKENIKKGNAYGFLYESINDENSVRVAGSYGLFELITLAHHGSVKCYRSEKPFAPVLYEYPKDVNQNKVEDGLRNIETIQEGILDYLRYGEKSGELNWDIFIKPTKEEVLLLGRLPFFDSGYCSLIDHSSLGQYIANPKKFKDDFYLSVWKIGFLKSVMGMGLPYFEIYKRLRR